jgi:hypothetical protein
MVRQIGSTLIARLRDKCGNLGLVVEVGSLHTPQIEKELPGAAVICFDPHADKIERNAGFRWERTRLILRRIGRSMGETAWPLDFFWDEFGGTIDLLLCNVRPFEPIILGANRTLMETRYAAFACSGGEDQRVAVRMLPGFELRGTVDGYVLFENKEPPYVIEGLT